MNEEQYKLTFARRIARDDLLWQTPMLAMVAQAFLLAAAFNTQTVHSAAQLLFIFSFVVGTASIQLMWKHRFLERVDSGLLTQFEEDHREEGYTVLHGPTTPTAGVKRDFLARLISVWIWLAVLIGFCLLAGYGLYSTLWQIK